MYDKYIQRRYKRSSKISVLLYPLVKILSFYHLSRCLTVAVMNTINLGKKGLIYLAYMF